MRLAKTSSIALALAFASLLASTASASVDAGSSASDEVSRQALNQDFVRLTRAGAWSFFSDPRAVQVRGKIFTGWTTMRGQVKVSSFDPGTGRIKITTVDSRISAGDDHENPALLVRNSGRITAFYSPHSGRIYPKGRKSRLYYRTTRRPADISSWNTKRSVPTNTRGNLGYTYPNPVALPAGKIFLAWRGGDWLPASALYKRGRWTRARGMIYSPHPRRPYVKTARDRRSNVLIAYNQDNPRQTRTNTYFIRYKPGRGYFRAGGRKIGGPNARVAAQKGDVVAWNGQNGRTWVMDVADAPDGSPVVLYAAGDRFSEMSYYLARYQAGSWTRTRIVGNGFDGQSKIPDSYHYYPSSGASLDHTDPDVVYLSRAVGPNLSMRVETWRLRARGNLNSGWSVVRNSPSTLNCFRPVGVRNGHVGDVAMMCGTYFSWLNFPTGIYLSRPRG